MAYPPPYYTHDDPAFAASVMADYPFALLTTPTMHATHLPLLHRGGALYGHLAVGNPIVKALKGGGEGDALAVFSGPHAYVSAALYDNPSRSVPTWNYVSVQVRGTLSVMEDADVVPHLDDMAQTFEREGGWRVSGAADYVKRLTLRICAVRMNIKSVKCIAKLSTNKDPAIQKRIIDDLSRPSALASELGPARATAALMAKNLER